jgi:hypothetical protein
MISKKRLSKTQRITLRMIDAAEWFGARVYWFIGGGAVLFGIYGVNTITNNIVLNTCDRSLYVVTTTPTAIGPAYNCVSRALHYGPAPTYKD